MAKSEKDRNWEFDKESLEHPYFVDKTGIYFFIKKVGFHFHFNPYLIYKVLKSKASDIILGGSWNDINILIFCVLKKMRITRKIYHIWSEANIYTLGSQNDSSIKRKLRNFVFKTVDGNFIVPGRMSELTFNKWGVKNKRFVLLPNLINESTFSIDQGSSEKRKKNDLPIFFMPVRLLERIKGILNFFNAIGIDNIKKAKFLIAGNGDDSQVYQSFVMDNNLQENIILLGFQDYHQINQLYNQANVFLLPSFSDPSPLSLVEALKMKLPVLVSLHCGNHYEALKDGYNGYGFNPYNPLEIKGKFEKLMLERDKWELQGQNSYQMYLNNFDKKKSIESFMKQMNSCYL
ncbi:glycosyltransferase family 4 protein [Capnocytophaga canimorsus]|nr:glycosyltransferase family 4 protein [Capnocytophaga canimorsus]